MRNHFFILLLVFTVAVLPQSSFAGNATSFYVVSASIAEGATNVPASTSVISLTFSVPVDTTFYNSATGMMLNFTTNGGSWSPDCLTANISVTLSADQSYFLAMYASRAQGGASLASPFILHFTTGSVLPPYSVSGTITSSAVGVSPAGALVIASTTPIGNGNEHFAQAAAADGSGNYTLPYLGNDSLYIVSAVDVDKDGNIDPSSGDALGLASSVVVVNGANVTGVDMVLHTYLGLTYADAIDSLNARKSSFSPSADLRQIAAYKLDASGRANDEWQFLYIGPDQASSFEFDAQSQWSVVRQMDPNTYQWVSQWGVITAPPTVAAVDTFLSRAERQGGGSFRPVPTTWKGFNVQVQIGTVGQGWFGGMVLNNGLYLGINYFYYSGSNDSNQTPTYQRLFLGDFTTGQILQTLGVKDGATAAIPKTFAIDQNYPNPFNPSTTIAYALPAQSRVTLTVYNLLGQRVATLVNGIEEPGSHQVAWQPDVASGIYFYRIDAVATDNPAQKFMQVRKMALIR